MRLTGKPGEWLWRRLRLGTWFTRRKAERLTGTAAKADPDDAERGADRAIHRDYSYMWNQQEISKVRGCGSWMSSPR